MVKGPPPKFHGTRDNLRLMRPSIQHYEQRQGEAIRMGCQSHGDSASGTPPLRRPLAIPLHTSS